VLELGEHLLHHIGRPHHDVEYADRHAALVPPLLDQLGGTVDGQLVRQEDRLGEPVEPGPDLTKPRLDQLGFVLGEDVHAAGMLVDHVEYDAVAVEALGAFLLLVSEVEGPATGCRLINVAHGGFPRVMRCPWNGSAELVRPPSRSL
jgi:hypothetical protein